MLCLSSKREIKEGARGMSELEHKCEAGCLRYTCGSYKHVKSCKNYPESQSEIVDNLKFENEKLKAENERLNKKLESVCVERSELKRAIVEAFLEPDPEDKAKILIETGAIPAFG